MLALVVLPHIARQAHFRAYVALELPVLLLLRGPLLAALLLPLGYGIRDVFMAEVPLLQLFSLVVRLIHLLVGLLPAARRPTSNISLSQVMRSHGLGGVSCHCSCEVRLLCCGFLWDPSCVHVLADLIQPRH